MAVVGRLKIKSNNSAVERKPVERNLLESPKMSSQIYEQRNMAFCYMRTSDIFFGGGGVISILDVGLV